jgi:hypothetical protein
MVGEFPVGEAPANKEVNETTCNCVAKRKSSFLLSTFLWGSGTDSTGFLMFPCLKEPDKTAFDVWFYVFMIISSKSMVFFHHQNKGRHARGVEVSSL